MLNLSNRLSAELKLGAPVTDEILRNANLTIHPAVYRVVLSGSRGPKGGFRPDSDIDLSLLIDAEMLSQAGNKDDFLRNILETTLCAWESGIALDTVAVFDQRNCGLNCFQAQAYHDGLCGKMADDCPGLYKIQKGFSGFVPPIGVQIKKVFPFMTIWQKESGSRGASRRHPAD